MFRFKFNSKKEYELMTNIADNVLALQASVTALQAAVSAIATPPAPVVDFTPILTAIAGVAAELVPTPPSA